MSQSDYITYKKTGIKLKNNNKSTILSSSDYSSFINYNIMNTSPNNKINYGNDLNPYGTKLIFDMKINNSINCPNFICNTTSNTVLQGNTYSHFLQINEQHNEPPIACLDCFGGSVR